MTGLQLGAAVAGGYPVVPLAVFLAGRASAYVTGQSIHVDGGFSVH